VLGKILRYEGASCALGAAGASGARRALGAPHALGAVLAFASLLAAAPARADTAFDMQVWTAAFLTARLSGREPEATSGVSGWLDLHARRTGGGVIGIVRPALGYRFSKAVSVWAGYAVIGLFDDLPENRAEEHRAWQQGLFSVPLGALTLQIRPRLEERFREGQSDVAFRARLFVRANVAFRPDLPVILATWTEPFFHLNDAAWGPRGGFDQNRLFLGLGIKGPASTRLEVGYLNVTVSRPVGLAIAHNIGVNLFADL
jgi:hypothetical protein